MGCFTMPILQFYPRLEPQAQFTDDGTSILVSFSLEGSASSGLIDADDAESGNGPGPCDALLDAASIPPLGEGATCAMSPRKKHTMSIPTYM